MLLKEHKSSRVTDTLRGKALSAEGIKSHDTGWRGQVRRRFCFDDFCGVDRVHELEAPLAIMPCTIAPSNMAI
ncbi:hypothetical protein Mapa_005577 [Marchantia paleacea]|nr:hypothetical protein Mapa_005577 [Marchantia paleacea]